MLPFHHFDHNTSVLRQALGAEGEILALTAEYIRVIALGTVFQLLTTGFVPFIRNMGGSTFAMAAMIAGFLTNVALDYFFVPPWGMAGAAWATVLGQAVTMLAVAGFFLIKRAGFHLPALSALPGFMASVCKVAVAPFGLTISPTITIILMNRFLLLHGVGDGSQPLISKHYGEKDYPAMLVIRRLAYLTGAVITAACVAGLFLARESVGVLFGASPDREPGRGKISSDVPDNAAASGVHPRHHVLFLRHGKDRALLCPGVFRAGIPAAAFLSFARMAGPAGRVAGGTGSAGFGVGCFLWGKASGRPANRKGGGKQGKEAFKMMAAV